MNVSIDASQGTRRALRAARRQDGRRARLRGIAWSTLSLGAATLLGLGAVGGTYALFNDSATMPGARISAGTMSLQVNGASTAALGSWTITPASRDAKSFTVTNVSAVPVDISANAVVTSATGLGANTTASLVAVAASADCTTATFPAPAALNGYARTRFVALAPGATQKLCLSMGALSSTPVAQSGQTVNFTMTMTSLQREN